MPGYIGRDPQTANYVLDPFAGDDSIVSFELSRTPASANAILVIISGVVQRPIDAYDIVGADLIFTEAPPTPPAGVTNNIEVLHLGDRVQLSQPADGSVGLNQLSDNMKNYRPHTWTGDDTETDFTMTYAVAYANSVLVTLDGVVQEPGVDYGIDSTGLILQFVSAPAYDVKISALQLGIRSIAEVVGNTVNNFIFTAIADQTSFTGLDDNGELLAYAPGNNLVFLNGVRLLEGVEYTDSGGAEIVLTTGANASDILELWTVGSWASADHYTKTEADAKYSLIGTGAGKIKNALINGNFDIWQRGIAFTGDEYTADRWNAWAGSGGTHAISRQTFTLGQTAVPDNPMYYWRQVLSGVGTDSAGFEQRIESVRIYNGDQVTVSFWAKVGSAISGNVRLVQNFGTSGSPSSEVKLTEQSISLTTSWVLFTKTFTVPSISGKTLGDDINDYLSVQIYIGDDATAPASTYTLDVSRVQIELGTSATDWERRPINEIIASCQRYFEKSYDLDVDPGTVTPAGHYIDRAPGTITDYLYVSMPTSKRTNPSITLYSTNDGASGNWYDNSGGTNRSVGSINVGNNGFIVSMSGTGDNNLVQGHWAADAEL